MADKKDEKEILIEDIDHSRFVQREFREQWEEVDNVYDGNYDAPWAETMDGDAGKIPWVKSGELNKQIRENLSVLGLEPNFSFHCTAAQQNNDLDTEASDLAEMHLKYMWREHDWFTLANKLIVNQRLYGKGYLRLGYRASVNPDEIISDDITETTLGNSGVHGQSWEQVIRNQDFIIADGFRSIKEAEQPGGYIGVRSWALIDWVKKNPAYSEKQRAKIKKGDVYKPYMEDEFEHGADPATPNETQNTRDNRYVALWEIFYAPTPKYPEGRYFVIHKRSKTVLFKENKLPYINSGLIYPVKELVLSIDNDYYTKSLSYRSLNALREYESYESKLLWLAQNIKKIIVLSDEHGSDTLTDTVKGTNAVNIIQASKMGRLPASQLVELIDIDFNMENLRVSSMAALARFKSIFKQELISPVARGEKVATEMRLNTMGAIQEANTQKSMIAMFWKSVAEDVLKIVSRNMPEEEQRLITRAVDKTFQPEQDAHLLMGDYNVDIIPQTILDMSFGDEINAYNMLISQGMQVKMTPEGQNVNIVDVYRQMCERLGADTSKIILPPAQASQESELNYLLIGVPVPVKPEDNHLEHAQVLSAFFQNLQQIEQQPPAPDGNDPQITEQGYEYSLSHLEEHVQMGELESNGSLTGAWAQIKNVVNNARAAGGGIQSQAGGPQEGGMDGF